MSDHTGLSQTQAVLKRGFDVFGASIGLALTFWLIALAWLAATIETRAIGFFIQRRVGRHGRAFPVIKLRTMRVVPGLGITGPATLKYRDEETLLASVGKRSTNPVFRSVLF